MEGRENRPGSVFSASCLVDVPLDVTQKQRAVFTRDYPGCSVTIPSSQFILKGPHRGA